MNMEAAATIDVGSEEQLVTMRINKQILGIPVKDVREILRSQKITNIPLVPEEIAGVLNLRGRIVTAIDIRHRLQLKTSDQDADCIFVVVEHNGELYSLIVDSVGEVIAIPSRSSIQEPPPNLAQNWRDISAGVYWLEQELLIIIDLKSLFQFAG